MKLKTKFLKWSAGLPVAMIHKNAAAKMGVHEQGRISIKEPKKNAKELSTLIDTTRGLVKEDEIAISSEIRERMGLKKDGQYVDINLTKSPHSLNYIKKKLDNKKLSQEEISEIISDITSNGLSQPETALFVSAMYTSGMSHKETVSLINSILENGNKLNLRNKFVADKHSIGGIPGNRTTPIVVSICAAAGLTMPKNSSKAITSAAGTADTIETLAPVEFNVDDLKKIVKKTGASLVWGGAVGMVPADSKIIRVEKMIEIDPRAQLLASIMSKKLAASSDYIIIDIPYGPSAKVTKKEAEDLKRDFKKLAKDFKKHMDVIITKGDGPIGQGIGPVLEMKDVLSILDPLKKGPEDLEEKSLFLAGRLLELTGKSKKDKGKRDAREILKYGDAFNKFKEIIKAQGGSIKDLSPGKHKHRIVSKKSGKIGKIDNKLVNSLARTAGCPADKKAGICLQVKEGDKVKKEEELLTIFAESDSRLHAATDFCRNYNPIKVE